ncbi:right-handed parallel beta-helix repeat-containing protein [Verrucomicrobiaceae bacterium 227]
MESPPSQSPTVAEARKRLGLGDNDRLADFLPHWKEVEIRLAELTGEAKDPVIKESYANDLASLRQVLTVLEGVPSPPEGVPAANEEIPVESAQDAAVSEEEPPSLEAAPVVLDESSAVSGEVPAELGEVPILSEEAPVELGGELIVSEEAPVVTEAVPAAIEGIPDETVPVTSESKEEPPLLETAPVVLEEPSAVSGEVSAELGEVPILSEEAPVELGGDLVGSEEAPVVTEAVPAAIEGIPDETVPVTSESKEEPPSLESAPVVLEEPSAASGEVPAELGEVPILSEKAPVELGGDLVVSEEAPVVLGAVPSTIEGGSGGIAQDATESEEEPPSFEAAPAVFEEVAPPLKEIPVVRDGPPAVTGKVPTLNEEASVVPRGSSTEHEVESAAIPKSSSEAGDGAVALKKSPLVPGGVPVKLGDPPVFARKEPIVPGQDRKVPKDAPAVFEEVPAKRKSKAGFLTWLILIALLAGAGFWGYRQWAGINADNQARRVGLEETLQEFDQAIEKRRWDEAELLVGQLQKIGGSEEQIADAAERIEQGKVEEKGQQIAFLVGNAQSALEAGQLTEAENYCAQVDELQPDHPQLADIRSQIKESRMRVRSLLMVREIEKAMQDEDWRVAESQLASLVEEQPEHAAIPRLRSRLVAAKKVLMENQAKAAVLLAKARELDEGVYSAEALTLLEEAVRLDPSEEIRAIYKRMSEYGKVMRVPSEYPTIAEALKGSKANDRIFVEKGTYTEALIVPPGVEIVGESRAETILECPAEEAAVIAVGKGSKKVRVASLTLRHQGLVNDDERFPVVLIDSGRLLMEDVLVSRASGHGVAVLNGGHVTLMLCKVVESGWDGVSVKGEKTGAILNQVTSEGNLHHGVDFWDGANGEISKSQFLANGRAGVTAIGSTEVIKIEESRCEGNREIGFFFSHVLGVELNECDAHKNQLGGIVFEHGSKGVKVTNSRVSRNGKAGIVFEKGVEILANESNKVEKNDGHQVWSEAVFVPRTGDDTITPPPPAPPVEDELDKDAPAKADDQDAPGED